MTEQDKRIPDWVRKERYEDMTWIAENMTSFWPVARDAFNEHGRGALVIDTSIRVPPTGVHPIFYAPQLDIENQDDENTKRLVREYNPQREFVVMMLKQAGEELRISAYRAYPLRQRPRR